MKVEEFTEKAIEVAKQEGQKGVSRGVFREAFRMYFRRADDAALARMEKEGKVVVSPNRVYLTADAPPLTSRQKAEKLVRKLRRG